MDQTSKTHENIEHPGIIDKIENERVWVKIQPQSACGSCHSKSYCSMAESVDKVIEVQNEQSGKALKKGERVKIVLRRSLGYKALFLGYLLPFLILIFSLIITLSLHINEGLAAGISILLLVPYYSFLYVKRDAIRSSFHFFIK